MQSLSLKCKNLLKMVEDEANCDIISTLPVFHLAQGLPIMDRNLIRAQTTQQERMMGPKNRNCLLVMERNPLQNLKRKSLTPPLRREFK
jgi:hypothetical protein